MSPLFDLLFCRLCTEATGSRGEFLLAADAVKFDLATNESVQEGIECLSTPRETSSCGDDMEPNPINMCVGSDIQLSDFLHTVLFDGLRLMINIDTRNALYVVNNFNDDATSSYLLTDTVLTCSTHITSWSSMHYH